MSDFCIVTVLHNRGSRDCGCTRRLPRGDDQPATSFAQSSDFLSSFPIIRRKGYLPVVRDPFTLLSKTANFLFSFCREIELDLVKNLYYNFYNVYNFHIYNLL